MKLNLNTKGCGAYKYKSFIGEGPKYSFSTNISKNEKMLKKILKISRSFVVPGPGMYDIKTKNKGIRYTMGYRRDQKIKSLKSIIGF